MTAPRGAAPPDPDVAALRAYFEGTEYRERSGCTCYGCKAHEALTRVEARLSSAPTGAPEPSEAALTAAVKASMDHIRRSPGGGPIYVRSQIADELRAAYAVDFRPPTAGNPEERRRVLEEVRALEKKMEASGDKARFPGEWSAAAVLLGELDVEEGKYRPAAEVFANLRERITSAPDVGNPIPADTKPEHLYPRPSSDAPPKQETKP